MSQITPLCPVILIILVLLRFIIFGRALISFFTSYDAYSRIKCGNNVIFVLFLTRFTGQKHSFEVYKEFPPDWFEGLNIKMQITSSMYHNEVNTYKVKCGGSLEMWESSGWIHKQDPYGWFHW